MNDWLIEYKNIDWFGPLKKRPLRLLLEFEDFCQKVEPFNDETFKQFEDDVFKFWSYVRGTYKELAAVALKIFRICVILHLKKMMINLREQYYYFIIYLLINLFFYFLLFYILYYIIITVL